MQTVSVSNEIMVTQEKYDHCDEERRTVDDISPQFSADVVFWRIRVSDSKH
jgi:hypothetical protein